MPCPTVPPEIHLRRLTADEALYRLDAYLDDAFMAGRPAAESELTVVRYWF